MPAIDFPNSPAVNDTYTVGDRTWKWNGSTWTAVRFFSGSAGNLNLSSVIFEGSTSDDFETTLTVADPTADRTVTLPNATTTLVGTDTTDTLTNKTLSSSVLSGTTKTDQLLESVTVSATAATGTINYDLLTNKAVTYYTANASGNWTLNVRGNATTTLDSIMSSGQSLSIAFFATNGSTAYYQSAMQIDGNAVTAKWKRGTAPTAGSSNSVDAYSFSIIKTGSNTFTVLADTAKFA